MLAALFAGIVASVPAPSDAYTAAIDRLAGGVPADDATFLRRVSLDVAGVIPRAEEVEEFLADRRSGKRERMIDAAIASPAAAEYFAAQWSNVLIGRLRATEAAKERRIDRANFEAWLAAAWAGDRGWDQIVAEMITAAGRPDESGPVTFLLARETPEEVTGDSGRLFWGVSLQCAECHDHPEQEISREHFLGMLAFFSHTRVRLESAGVIRRPAVRDGTFGVAVRSPETGAAIEPRFLGGERVEPKSGAQLRSAFAELITGPDHPWFARAFVNRVWADLIGRPLVEPLEELGAFRPARELGPATAGENLLAALAAAFEADRYRVRGLVRGILRSQAYSAAWSDRGFFRAAKPMTPEQLFASFVRATGVDQTRELTLERRERLRRRALAAIDLVYGGEDDRPHGEPIATVPLELMRLNSEVLARAIQPHPGSALAEVLDGPLDISGRVRALYFRTVSRAPSADEVKAFSDYLEAAAESRPKFRRAHEDVFWALLASTEFLTND